VEQDYKDSVVLIEYVLSKIPEDEISHKLENWLIAINNIISTKDFEGDSEGFKKDLVKLIDKVCKLNDINIEKLFEI
jgi:hypothetical protein